MKAVGTDKLYSVSRNKSACSFCVTEYYVVGVIWKNIIYNIYLNNKNRYSYNSKIALA